LLSLIFFYPHFLFSVTDCSVFPLSKAHSQAPHQFFTVWVR